MDNKGKTIEELNRSMSFEEFKQKGSNSRPKQSKFKKFLKFILLLPVRAGAAILGIDKEDVTSSSRGGGGGGGEVPTTNTLKESYRVDLPQRPSHEDMVIAHMAHDAYMDLVDGKGDHDCGHEH